MAARKTTDTSLSEERMQLREMPKGVNPIPYFFWFSFCMFKNRILFRRLVIFMILVALIGLLYGVPTYMRSMRRPNYHKAVKKWQTLKKHLK
jgi:hypothetical protein